MSGVLEARSISTPATPRTPDMSDCIETLSLSSQGSSDTQSMRSEDMRTSPASTTLRPRFGKEYQRLNRKKLLEEPEQSTPQSPSVASVFTFDVSSTGSPSSRMSYGSSYSRGEETPSPRSPSQKLIRDHLYMNVMVGKDKPESPRAIYMNVDLTPPGSPQSMCSISPAPPMEQVNPELNYALIDHSKLKDSKNKPRKPPQKSSNIEYAEIDMVATAAARRVGKEHAQLREDSLRRKGDRTIIPVRAQSAKERKGSSSSSKERKPSVS